MSSNRELKKKLLEKIEGLAKRRGLNPKCPLTDTPLSQEEKEEIEAITEYLESLNPFPKPLVYGVSLLDGVWQLHYSTAREIRRLNQLPFGLQLCRVYQTINTKEKTFFNIAFVEHKSGIIRGYVKVTASFYPRCEEGNLLPDNVINVNFEKRSFAIQNMAGIKTPFFEPIRIVEARNPQERIPSLKITYIDEDMRIGRGGDGSLFILSRRKEIPELS
ncbi:MAG: PAP/fibrillin family protein [Geminocystis sp.]|nr:PAP/fibrillin family protein [Geminocystis sp.]HIK37134.1 fimbrial protein [Geminocystis sp. M7585_C2015_104]MCS7147496.1 PAP/fibrillin family protein [Geminocystis sp.]MCX8077899.1 PAP/fibrillin family protein [Geminocystis sp.]MDW8115189.1 PAP/fibrillin family protein [Geminocystis sp.]